MSRELANRTIDYMQMVQGIINRMASTSATCKGFAATMVAAVLAILVGLGNQNKLPVFGISVVSLFVFAAMDGYYYWLERVYRKQYERARDADSDFDFDLRPPKDIKIPISEIIWSKGILVFYGFMLVMNIVCTFCLGGGDGT